MKFNLLPIDMSKLNREFYNRNTIIVARELLGKELIHHAHGITHIGKIVEVEAYLGQNDLASHSSKGLTQRNRIMFGPPGYAYVYMIYGMYHCFNVVTEATNVGAAVLIRAIEPVININQRSNGPGLLCKAMNITREQNGWDLLDNALYLQEPREQKTIEIMESARIGVDYAKEWAYKPLRFYIRENLYVSKIKKKPG